MTNCLVILGTELAHYGTCLPHLALAEGTELLFELLAVVGLRVAVDRDLSLVAGLHALVELLHDGLDGIVERTHPVEGTTLSGGRAVGIHPVHTVLGEEGHERLGELLNGLVEGLRGGVTILAEHLVLSKEQALDSTHQ